VQVVGKLTCSQPFPSMPVKFWRDPDGDRYRAAYFEKFEGVWSHGDYARLTPRGGLIIYGRAARTMPAGFRLRESGQQVRLGQRLARFLNSRSVSNRSAGVRL
jgi:acetoacetyl-CoA synthetase